MAKQVELTQIISRTVLVVVGVLAALSMLVGVLLAVLWGGQGSYLGYSFDVTALAREDLNPKLAASPETAVTYFDRLHVSASGSLSTPRTLSAIADGSLFVVFLLGCAVILVLVQRLWVGRPFSRLAGVSLAVFGPLLVALGVARPLLHATAVRLAIEELGLTTLPEWQYPQAQPALPDAWVIPPAWDWTNTEWPTVVLGLVLGLLGWLLLRGVRLQREVEGLV